MCYDVNRVCKFMHAITETRWDAVKHILYYLHATTSYGLHITHSVSLSLHGFSDVDWAILCFMILPLSRKNKGKTNCCSFFY